jgi:hypothetical protein
MASDIWTTENSDKEFGRKRCLEGFKPKVKISLKGYSEVEFRSSKCGGDQLSYPEEW